MRANQVISNHPQVRAYCDHYLRQSKHRGGAIPYFKGAEHQHGSGIGSVLTGIGRTILPSLAPVVLDGATSLIGYTIGGLEAGQNIGDALLGALAPTGKALLGSTINEARTRVNNGAKGGKKQSGGGLAIPGKKVSAQMVYKGKNIAGPPKKKTPERKPTKAALAKRQAAALAKVNTNF